MQFGVPCIVHEADTDAGHPTNLLDSDWDEDSLVLPPERPLNEPTPVLLYCFKSRLLRLTRKVIRHALSPRPPAYSDTVNLSNELHSVWATVPPFLKVERKLRDCAFDKPAGTITHSMMLTMVYLQAICVLHRGYLTYEKDNPVYEPSRNEVRAAALRTIELQVEFETETKPGGRLAGERQLANSISTHAFLLASTIVCLDLTESVGLCPESAETARKVSALKDAYDIWNARKATSRDAVHATKVLGAIIKKVHASLRDARRERELQIISEQSSLNGVSSSSDGFDLMSQDWDAEMPFGEILNDPDTIDWVSITSLLHIPNCAG